MDLLGVFMIEVILQSDISIHAVYDCNQKVNAEVHATYVAQDAGNSSAEPSGLPRQGGGWIDTPPVDLDRNSEPTASSNYRRRMSEMITNRWKKSALNNNSFLLVTLSRSGKVLAAEVVMDGESTESDQVLARGLIKCVKGCPFPPISSWYDGEDILFRFQILELNSSYTKTAHIRSVSSEARPSKMSSKESAQHKKKASGEAAEKTILVPDECGP